MAKNLQAYKLGVVIDAQGAKALQTMRDADKQASKTAATFKQLEQTSATWGRNLSIGVTAPLVGFGVAAVRTATQIDSLTRGLRAVTGSSAETERQLIRLKEVAKLPGLGFKEAIQGSINLQAAGISAQLSERSLKAFGNALATVGKGKAELDGVILALGQIESKGKVSAEEINQLAERVPQIRKAIIAAFGTADTEVIQKAKITSRQFIDAVVTELERLPQATGGAQNTFENLSDAAEQSMNKIGTAALRVAVPALEKLAPKVEAVGDAFAKMSPEAQNTALAVTGVAIAAGPALTILSKLTAFLSGAAEAAVRLAGAIAGIPAALRLISGVAGTGIATLGAGAASIGTALLQQGDVSPTARRQRDEGDARAREAQLQASAGLRGKLFGQLGNAGNRNLRAELEARTTPAEPAENKPKIDLSGLAKDKNKGTGRAAAKQAERDARAEQDALTAIEMDGIEARLRIEQDAGERRTRTLRDAYEASYLTTTEYYKRLAQVAAAGTDAELRALDQKQRLLGLEQARTKPGGADALRLQGQILQLDTERYLKLSEGIAKAADNLREFKREMGGLGEVDLSQQAQVIDIVPEIIRRARERNAQLNETAGRGDLVNAELDRDRERIQTRVAQGTMTEAAAKRETLALEREYRDQIIAVLEAKKELAGLDAAAIAALDAQIERAKQLGTATAARKEAKPVFLDKAISITDAEGEANPAATAAESASAGLKAAGEDAAALAKGGFGQLASGLGGILEQFVMLGETGPGAMRKLAAGVLASLAMQAATKSIFYFAEGVAAATNPFTAYMAPGYFTASAIMAGIAAGSALGGRLVAGKSNKGQISDEQRRQATIANVASEGYAGNNFQRRATGGPVMAGQSYVVGEHRAEVFTPDRNGYIFPSVNAYSREQRHLEELRGAAEQLDGSIIGRMLNETLNKLQAQMARNANQLARLEAVNGDNMFVRMAERNARAVGRVTVTALDQDDQLSSRLGRRIAA